MRLCLALGMALGLGLALALCLLCLLWPWPGPVGAAWVVLSEKFSMSFLGFGQIRLIHEDGGECFTACEVVSQNCRFCFLFEWVAWVWHVWFQHGRACKSRIPFLEIDVLWSASGSEFHSWK